MRIHGIAAALASATLLTSCAALAPLAGGAALGGVGVQLANIKADEAMVSGDVDTTLAVVKPLNEALCYVEPWKPHSAKAQAAIKAFCANLPSDPKGLWDQTVAIYKAVKAADAAQGAAK